MSASSKPPRGTHNAKPPTTERVARALLDAEVFGDKSAARRHGVHANTIKNWRRDFSRSAEVTAEVKRLRAAVSADWIERARDLRAKLIDRIGTLAETNPSMRATTEALRRVHEVIVSHEILADDPEAAADVLSEQPDRDEAPGEAEGARGDGGDEEPPDLGGGEG